MTSATVQFNQKYFDEILRSSGVQRMQLELAEKVLAKAKATAPEESGDYKRGLHIERAERGYRFAFLVVGDDWKTLLVESQTGNLARALKSVGRGR